MREDTIPFSEAFALRRTDFHGVAETERAVMKWYSMSASGRPVGAAGSATARSKALSLMGQQTTGSRSVGFGIYHVGEEADWLQIGWWEHDILHSRVLTRRLSSDEPFTPPAKRSTLACVWELHVIDFERRAWAARVLVGSDLAGYLRSGLVTSHGMPMSPQHT